MLTGKKATFITNYFKRFAANEVEMTDPVEPSCKMAVVIPCFNEPDLIGTLDSLSTCSLLDYPVEVIVVVNQSEKESHQVEQANTATITDFERWNLRYQNQNSQNPLRLRFFLIRALDLPVKQAGVGLARKTGMDEALRRFVSNHQDGTIVCLDADCRVSPDYLLAIDSQFVQTEAGIGEMHFEHHFQQEQDGGLKKGIINYELFLRYYVEGLRQSTFPHAIHTIGSCMLVKASVYAKHGGMNKRKAGEDFYFLHKIVPHERFITVNRGTVFPSCRTSDRVPFGTGKAQQDWLDQETDRYLTYDPQVFSALKSLIELADEFYESPLEQVIPQLPGPIVTFLAKHEFDRKIGLIKSNCKSREQFHKQFFIWFDGFLCMKLIHFLRDEFYPNIPIEKAAAQLIKTDRKSAEELLEVYRINDLRQSL